jgi:hypothetical protein
MRGKPKPAVQGLLLVHTFDDRMGTPVVGPILERLTDTVCYLPLADTNFPDALLQVSFQDLAATSAWTQVCIGRPKATQATNGQTFINAWTHDLTIDRYPRSVVRYPIYENMPPIALGPSMDVKAFGLASDGMLVVAAELPAPMGQLGLMYQTPTLMRMTSDGLPDPTFHPTETYPNVYDIRFQNDGKILLLGDVVKPSDSVGFHPRGRGIQRLNGDGTPDKSFNANIKGGFDQAVRSAYVLPNGKIVLGGAFTNFSGTNRQAVNGLAVLNPDGSLDVSFGNKPKL